MLATLYAKPFDRKGWIFEIKWDGYRALGFKNKTVQLLSRNGLSFNRLFPQLVVQLKSLGHRFCVDGEIVIFDSKGVSRFQLLQNYQKTKQTPFYILFDILTLDGRDLRQMPLLERKRKLKQLLSKARTPQIRLGEWIEEKGTAFFRLAKKKGLEGIMAKKEDSPYQMRRSRDWLKIKTLLRQEFVIGGYTPPKGSRRHLGALLVGVYDHGKLRYVGKVGGGFNAALLESIKKQLVKEHGSRCPFEANVPRLPTVQWVKPRLVCEVSFGEWTQEGLLRQPIFKGIRKDKSAKEVVRETARFF